MTNGPRSMTVWCTPHRSNVTAGADGVLRHAPGGDLCDGTGFFMTVERMIDRDTAAAELARFTLPGAGQAYEGKVCMSTTMGDFTETETRVVREGVFQVSSFFQAIRLEAGAPGGWQCTRREARLNGELIVDPRRSQVLADEAGIETTERLRADWP